MSKPSVVSSNKLDHEGGLVERQPSAAAFGVRLEARLRELGKSASEIARVAGVTKQSMTGYVQGARYPGSDKLFALADAVDVDARWLATGVGAARPVELLDARDADWVEVPEYDLREMGDDHLGAVAGTAPIRRDWLYSTFRASTGLWLTRLMSDYTPAGLTEDTLVICRSIRSADLAEGHVCLWRAAERVLVGRFSVLPDTMTPAVGGGVPRDLRFLAPYLDPSLGAAHPDLLVPPSAIAAGRYHLVGRILGVMIRPI